MHRFDNSCTDPRLRPTENTQRSALPAVGDGGVLHWVFFCAWITHFPFAAGANLKGRLEMTRTILLIFALSFVTQSAFALSTNFEDLVVNTTYVVGNTFSSGDLSFEVVNFPGNSNVRVNASGAAGGAGNELFLGRSIALDFQLGSQVEAISLLFGDYFGAASAGLVINGVASAKSHGFAAIAGTTIAGVDVDVMSAPVVGGSQGSLILTGPIQSFAIGGTELAIDNVLVIVPEPTTILLVVMLGCVSVLARARRTETPAKNASALIFRRLSATNVP
jgi:hypothetical protein